MFGVYLYGMQKLCHRHPMHNSNTSCLYKSIKVTALYTVGFLLGDRYRRLMRARNENNILQLQRHMACVTL